MSHALKVATYNIRKAIGLDQRRNPERILAVLKEIDADIIALQEVDRRFGARVSWLAVPEATSTIQILDTYRFSTRLGSDTT